MAWDADRRDVVAIERDQVGAIVIGERPFHPAPDEARAALLVGLRSEGLTLLRWSERARSTRVRADLLHRHLGDPWPDLSEAALLDQLESWLVPYLGNARRVADLDRVDTTTALSERIGWDRVRELETLAPSHLEVPSGSRIRLRYDDPSGLPVLAVKLQELFGTTTSPTIAGGRVPVVVHLLSPAGRPVQITSDLAGFIYCCFATN